jgi:transcriptional regulator
MSDKTLLNRFFKLIEYNINNGSKFMWKCYGPNARTIEYWNEIQEGVSIQCVLDNKTERVYEMAVCDYSNNHAYLWRDPEFIELYDNEAKERNVNSKQAWDDIDYIIVELEDFFEKATAIYAGEEYDTRVVVPIDLPDDILFTLMKKAHEEDITFNQYIEQMLTKYISETVPEAISENVPENVVPKNLPEL